MSRIKRLIFLTLILLMVVSVTASARAKKVKSEKRESEMQELNTLIERANTLEGTIYPPDSSGERQWNDDYLAFRESVNRWAKKCKLRFRLMRDSRPLIFRGESMLRPRFKLHVSFYGMTCFLTGFEFSHSTFLGYYSCAQP